MTVGIIKNFWGFRILGSHGENFWKTARKLMFPRSVVLGLYRRILRTHRTVLPPELREFGDKYVTEEWHRHMNAKSQYVKPFLNEWNDYLSTLRAQKAGSEKIGKSLEPSFLESMDEEHKLKLQQLENEAKKAAHEIWAGGVNVTWNEGKTVQK